MPSAMATIKNETSGVRIVRLSLLKSVLQENHVNQAILRTCERLEQTFRSMKKSYCVKVEVLMSVLENFLTDCLTRVSPEITLLLFDYVLRYTLLVVLHGDWGESKVAKSHLQSLYKRFKVRAEKKNLAQVVGQIEYLVELMGKDPWGNAALLDILSGKRGNDVELLGFLQQEIGIFLIVRLEVMIYAQCEIQAMTLIEKCLHFVSSSLYSEYFQPFSDEITYLRDLYLILLNKAKSNSLVRAKILNEVEKMGPEKCLLFIYRCREGDLPFEHLLKITADVVVNTALAIVIIKEDTDEIILQELIKVWLANLTDSEDLKKLLRHFVFNAVRSRYVFAFCKLLIERFMLSEKALCVEIFVRALTLNVNEIETYKLSNEVSKVKESTVQLANGFSQLGDYLQEDVLLCRECVLTAFSLDPTLSCFERIKTLSEKSRQLFIEAEKRNEDIGNDLSQTPQRKDMFPQCDRNQEIVMEQCELEPHPISGKDHCNLSNHNKSKEGVHYCVETSPLLISQRVLVNDSIYSSATEEVNISHYTLTQEILKLSLEDKKHIHNVHYSNENNHDFVNVSSSRTVPFECVHIYNSETIGIPQILCDDLSALIDSGRNHDLAWDLEWPELYRRCELFLQGNKVFLDHHSDCNVFVESESKKRYKNVGNNPNDIHNVEFEISTKALKKKRKRK